MKIEDLVDTEAHTLKGDFGEEILQYCEQHSKVGYKCEDFSQVPFDCAYEIAVDVIEKILDYIESKSGALITVDVKKNLVMANTPNSLFQLYNEGVIGKGEHCTDTWYPIKGAFGLWVLHNEFPNTKGNEKINVLFK